MLDNIDASTLSNGLVKIGIEVEKLRLDRQGRVSRKQFPTTLTPNFRRYVGREYFEAQIEFALPPQTDAQANVDQANQVIRAVAAQLAPDEQLWSYSCPPALLNQGRDELISTIPEGTNAYRQALKRIYDVRRIMNNGVHLNISLSKIALKRLMRITDFHNPDALYLHIAQQFMVSQWVLTYLFGATPICFSGYLDNQELIHPVRSIRRSRLGFPTSIEGNYRSVTDYVKQIEAAVAEGRLLRANQYYEPVRCKSSLGKAPEHLLKNGISHLELRTFDLNPTTVCGVTSHQLRLISLLTVFFAMQPPLRDQAFQAQMIKTRQLSDRIAAEDPRQNSVCRQRGLALMARLGAFAQAHHYSTDYQRSLQHFAEDFADSQHTLAYQVWRRRSRLTEAVV